MDVLPAGRARSLQVDALPVGNLHTRVEELGGLSQSHQIHPTTTSWFDILGPMLLVHDSHGYMIFDRVMPTA